jgi:hypothetical protein
VRTPLYESELRPNTCLAGLLAKSLGTDKKKLVPFVFLEIALPSAPAHQTPILKSRLPQSHYVFCWDQRRRSGYLLVTPRPRDQHELRFHVEWTVPHRHVNVTSLPALEPNIAEP